MLRFLCNKSNVIVTKQGEIKMKNTLIKKQCKWISISVGILSALSIFVTTPADAATIHTVQKGEYLYLIAQKYGTTVDQLKQWNSLLDDTVHPNMQLVVSYDTSAPTTTNQSLNTTPVERTTTPVSPEASNTTYTVVAGDYLYKIAQKHGVTVEQLKAWNNLSSNFLQIGDKLVIKGRTTPVTTPAPVTPPTTSNTTYTVVAGDYLYKIAQKHGVTVEQLKAWNNLSSNFLQIGDKLVVKGGTTSVTTPAPVTPPTTSNTTYTVVAGDSLYKIAQRFGVTVEQLKAWNNRSNNLLYVGDKLNITAQHTSTPKTYIVKAGDSLWLIAKKYNVSVAQLKSWNNLSSNFLQIGDKLIIK